VPWAEVQHQEEAKQLVERAMGRSRVPHAYIFHGPEGVGKEMSAMALAGRLLRHNDDRPLASNPDLHLVYRQLRRDHPDGEVRRRKTQSLGVDVIRHFLIDRVWLTPVGGVAKVFIIREAERLLPPAQNAMLKTLEEPPAHTFLILLTTNPGLLLPTIHSRCQAVPFGTLPVTFIREKLAAECADLSVAALDFYARSCGGSIGQAIKMVDRRLFEISRDFAGGMAELTISNIDKTNKLWNTVSATLSDSFAKEDPEITKTEAKRRGFATLFNLAANWYSDVARIASAAPMPLVNVGFETSLDGWVKAVGVRGAGAAIQRIARAEYELGHNVNVGLCIENLVNDLGRLRAGDPLPV
jgi:DNA polymerase-3 subunit delta'